MLEKFIDKDNLTPEHMDMAYSKIKEYCEENNIDVLQFVKDESNIPLAAKTIQSKIPFAMRLIVKPKHLEEAIKNNIDFIIELATERYIAEHPVENVKLEEKKAKKTTRKKKTS